MFTAQTLCDSSLDGDIPNGEAFDLYKWIHKIGSGAYGSVWKALHVASRDIVAIKKFHREPENVWREASFLYTCKEEPAIIGLRAVVRDATDGSEHMVMDICDWNMDSTIKSMVFRNEKFLESNVRSLMSQILNGLKTMCDNGIVHRDLKPANILVDFKTDGWNVKICDFGLAMYLKEVNPSQKLGAIRSYFYMAPERLRGSEVFDPAIDVWSAGCIMAELILREPMFRGKSIFEQELMIADKLGVGSGTSRVHPEQNKIASCSLRKIIPEDFLSSDGL